MSRITGSRPGKERAGEGNIGRGQTEKKKTGAPESFGDGTSISGPPEVVLRRKTRRACSGTAATEDRALHLSFPGSGTFYILDVP